MAARHLRLVLIFTLSFVLLFTTIPSVLAQTGDGRINTDPVAPAFVYCRANGVEVLANVNGQGQFAFLATLNEIDAVGVPPVNTLIDAGFGISLYRLNTGEFQLVANNYNFIWAGCPGVGSSSVSTPVSSETDATVAVVGTLVYVVQPGDTLTRIAQRYGVSASDIAALNGLTNFNRIFVGQRLVVPVLKAGITSVFAPTGSFETAQSFNTSPYFTGTSTIPVVTINTGTTVISPLGQRIHVVQPGENLYRIALRYGVSLSVIAQVNGIPNVSLIYAGQQLIIP